MWGLDNNQLLAILLAGLMIVLWISEWIPVYLTALLPLLLAVPFGLLEPQDLAKCYGDSNIFLFFGGFVMALALEKWGVHEQIARRIIGIVGDKKSNILLGFILSTGLISMWISNTATALMMLPMAMAVVEAMPLAHRQSRFSVFLMLSIAYAANIGGVGTLIGSPPNTQMASILAENFNIEVSFMDWMKIGLPLSLVLLFLMFLIFNYFLGAERKDVHDLHFHTTPWTTAQKRVLWIFSGVAFLWIFRELFEQQFGWKYRDENAAILGALAMFLVPTENRKSQKILKWSDTEKLPWGILLLFGGGLALAAVLEQNGILELLSQGFKHFDEISVFLALICLTGMAIFISEVLSNLAMVTLFIPVVGVFAQQTGLPLLPLAMSLTLGASLAFMMPVGTPPNAIVFGSGYLKIKQMIRFGFLLNILSLVLICLFVILFL
ncbi:MAG: SLC13 family permease [Sphingomonadales bacterium]